MISFLVQLAARRRRDSDDEGGAASERASEEEEEEESRFRRVAVWGLRSEKENGRLSSGEARTTARLILQFHPSSGA